MQDARLIGRSAAHQALLETLTKVSPTDAEVLITGPSGVGKELYARHVHQKSGRRSAEFVAVNCGVLTGELLENELFGHIAGAFTGARPQHLGLVTAAEGGTLFLDEVDTLSAVNQVKLLRFVQEKEYRRLGETRVRRANVRFVAATNADLPEAVSAGRFRSDLFFRLRVVPVEVPPLCERREDIEPLLEAYIAHYAREYSAPPIELNAAARQALDDYDWPGNIRELENCVRYLTCLRLDRRIDAGDLPLLDTDPAIAPSPPARAETPARFQVEKRGVVDRFERDYLERALRQADGNIARAAQSSGKARRAFFELLRKHDIDAGRFRERNG
jgi:DNA-binding NtrC family response regulator